MGTWKWIKYETVWRRDGKVFSPNMQVVVVRRICHRPDGSAYYRMYRVRKGAKGPWEFLYYGCAKVRSIRRPAEEFSVAMRVMTWHERPVGLFGCSFKQDIVPWGRFSNKWQPFIEPPDLPDGSQGPVTYEDFVAARAWRKQMTLLDCGLQ